MFWQKITSGEVPSSNSFLVFSDFATLIHILERFDVLLKYMQRSIFRYCYKCIFNLGLLDTSERVVVKSNHNCQLPWSQFHFVHYMDGSYATIGISSK